MTATAGPRQLCRLADIPDGGGKGFRLGTGVEERALFLLRRGERVWAYANSCPHRGTPLDWVPDRFIDMGGRHVLCATHGALFRFEDGYCVSGPCLGSSLPSVAIRRRGEWIDLDEDGESM
jgi:nitrite reductase/ring-hydroxylating ferredoxin subunit